MSLPAAFVPILVSLLFITIPVTVARLWLRRIGERRRSYDAAERSVRLQALGDEAVAARARGERFVPPPGWDR